MQTTSLLEASPAFSDFKKKAESFLYNRYPKQFDSGRVQGISLGRNGDAAPMQRGGFRVAGDAATMAAALGVSIPSRTLDSRMIHPQSEAGIQTFRTEVSEVVLALAKDRVRDSMTRNPQLTVAQAQAKIASEMMKVGYFDRKSGLFVFSRVKDSKDAFSRVKDSVASGLTTPLWDISQLQKIFKTPFMELSAERLVSKVGVPNMWANMVQVFTQSFEGYARLANVARGDGDFNTSVAAKTKTSTMISEIVNLVIDYESPKPSDMRLAGQNGNWLSNAAMGEVDGYASLMLRQLENLLYYFGDTNAGFDGLVQIANRDSTYVLYPSTQAPAEYMWQNDGAGTGTGAVNMTVGADLLLMINHMIGEMLQDLNFLPVEIEINVSPILYKALSLSMNSKIYNQNNPLSIINTAFSSDEGVVGSMVTNSLKGVRTNFKMLPDPALAPNTSFNPTDEDLTVITFPRFQSALDDGNLSDLIMAPTAIDNLILPSAPGFRDGVVRTQLKRIGSLIAPVAGTVHVISGMGTNSRYTGPST